LLNKRLSLGEKIIDSLMNGKQVAEYESNTSDAEIIEEQCAKNANKRVEKKRRVRVRVRVGEGVRGWVGEGG
jgi:hypothetical protein